MMPLGLGKVRVGWKATSDFNAEHKGRDGRKIDGRKIRATVVTRHNETSQNAKRGDASAFMGFRPGELAPRVGGTWDWSKSFFPRWSGNWVQPTTRQCLQGFSGDFGHNRGAREVQ